MYGAFVLLTILAAGVFGALHNQISYTVSSEYFTRFKFVQFGLVDSDLPARVRASIVGVLASWWMGIPVGLIAGAMGYLHRDVKKMREALLRSLPLLAGTTFAVALIGFVYGVTQTQALTVDQMAAADGFEAADGAEDADGEAAASVGDPVAGWSIPGGVQDPRQFMRAGYMHNAAYLGGLIALPLCLAYHLRKRTQLH